MSRPASPRHGARLPAVLLSLGLLGGAPSCAARTPELLWSHDPQEYFSERDFAASFFSRSAVLITKDHDPASYTKGVKALDPQTGRMRWEIQPAEWVLHPPDAPRPLFIVNRARSAEAPGTPLPFDHAYREAVEIDPESGQELRRIPFARAIGTYDTRLFLAGGRLVFLTSADGGHTLGAVDLTTGAVVWELKSDADPLFPPLVLPDRVLFLGNTYIAYALDDGRELYRVKGACCSAVASPDGRHVYLRSGVDQTVEVFPDGRLGNPLRGDPAAASARFIVVKRNGLAAYAHGGSTPVYSVSAPDPDYTSAIALQGDALFFFRARDKALWMRDLGSGRERALFEIGSKFVVGPDATGLAPAHLSTPPAFDPPLLFVHDWTIRAYRIP